MEIRKFRIGNRLDARNMNGAVSSRLLLTDEDEENLAEFELMVTEATNLLSKEIDAISDGDFSIISELYERKTSILKSIELRVPLIQPFLNSSYEKERNLSEKLNRLKAVVDEDSALLGKMALAAGTIVKEIQRATERHSLKGLYGNTGQKITDTTFGTVKIDKSL